ncbi:MAG TPA: hypothetical protein DEB10_14445 [Ruminococcaceae bacterium]|jgi:hypothetical protein|nr:hypothetical protein [Oscillospiraceae bacterium]
MVSIVPADEQFIKNHVTQPDNEMQSSFCLAAYDGNTCIGYIYCKINEQEVLILELKTSDNIIAESMVRAALNASAGKGAVVAGCCNIHLFPLLKKLGFAENNGSSSTTEIRAEISSVLPDGGCKGCNK